MKYSIYLSLIILAHTAIAQGQYNWKVTGYQPKGYSQLCYDRNSVFIQTKSDTVFEAPFPEGGGRLQRINSYTREFVFTENGLYQSTVLNSVSYSRIGTREARVSLGSGQTNYPGDYLVFRTDGTIDIAAEDNDTGYVSLAEVYKLVQGINRIQNLNDTQGRDILKKRIDSLIAAVKWTLPDLSARLTRETIMKALTGISITDTIQVKAELDTLAMQRRSIEQFVPRKRWLVDTLHEQFPMTRMQLREKFMEQFRRMRRGSAIFTVGVHYTPSFANHSVLIGTTRFNDNKALDSRNEHENNRYGHELGVQLGLTFAGKHTLFIGGLHAMQGFRSRGQQVDWSSGMPVAGAGRNYRFEYNGLGLGYGFSSYRRLINLEAELGLYHLWLSRFDDGSTTLYKRDDIRGLGLKTEAWTGKLGVGLNIRPTYGTSFRLMPSLLYNFSTADKGTLRTKFFNLGLTVGCQFRLVWKSYRVEHKADGTSIIRRSNNPKPQSSK